jgi:hypothetical protein
MKRLVIKSGSKERVVYSPSRREKRKLLDLLPLVTEAERLAAAAAGVAHVAHGFVHDRSPVTGALPHVGYGVTVSADLCGWFDSVRAEQIPLPPDIVRAITIDGVPRQGLPTSPAACNLAAIPMDRAILDSLLQLPGRCAYTRYADDLIVSFDQPCHYLDVLAVLQRCAQDMGWEIHPGKCRVQFATQGHRVILGLSVGGTKLKATRQTRKKLRAARHQAGVSPVSARSAAGLAEWCACKLPRKARGVRHIAGAIAKQTTRHTTTTPLRPAGGGSLRRITLSPQEPPHGS